MEEKLSPRRRLYDRGMRGLVWLCAGLFLNSDKAVALTVLHDPKFLNPVIQKLDSVYHRK